jgi:Tfp pilus assembly protein FimV
LPINAAVGNDSVDSALATLLGTDVASGKAGKSQSGNYGSTYNVRRGDTLDAIIRQSFNSSKIRRPIIRQAFVKANPSAFRRGNPNWMYAGKILTMPEVRDFQKAIFVDGAPAASGKRDWVSYP